MKIIYPQRSERQTLKRAVASIGLALGLCFSASPVLATHGGSIGAHCLEDRFGGDTVCTANDVVVASYDKIAGPNECIAGETVTVTLKARTVANANERYDIGYFIALDGGDATSGACYNDYLHPASVNNNDLDLLGGSGPFYNAEILEDSVDSCADIQQGNDAFFSTAEVTLVCQDVDANGTADVGTCTSWKNSKSDGDNKPSCTSELDTAPETKSKCKCGSVEIAGLTVKQAGTISVNKVLSPSTDSGVFNLQIDDTNEATDVGDGGTTGVLTVTASATPGETHTVGEAAGTDTLLADYDSEISCSDGTDTVGPEAGTGPVNVPVESNDAWVCTITNTLKNQLPTAVNDFDTTNEDTAVTTFVLTNDNQGDAPAQVTSNTNGTNGTVACTSTNCTYTPDADFNGSDSFQYTITDANGDMSTATVTITVTAVNDAPVANDDNANVNEDGTVDIPVLSNDTDLDGDTLSVTAVSDPANGTASINPDGTVNYTPEANFCGTDTLTYDISDGNGGTDTATVTVVVACVNDAPDAVDDADTTPEDTPVTTSVLPNDTDADGDTLTVTSATNGANGSTTVNADGTITYTPNENFNGVDTYTYEISDGNGGAATATVTITVAAVNDAPVANDDADATPEDTPVTISVLPNDTDADGDTLTVTSATNGTNGTTTVNADGTITYTPNENFNGVDTYTYEISDGNGGTDTATVTITVAAVNDAPDAVDDNANVNEDGTVDIPVLSNDTDLDGDTLSVTAVSDPANGTASINPDGTVNYTPEANFCGTDTLTYDISDGNGGTDTATVTVVVACVNDAPDAVDDADTTPEDTPVTTSVLPNDTDADGDTLTVTSATNGANGSTTVNADGTITYTPNENFNGVDTYTYEISDGNGGADTATVTITVTAVNDAPDAVDDADTTPEDTPVTTSVLPNDTDADGDTLTVTSATNGTNGSTTVNADGTITYTPNENFNGVDTYTYEISDGDGGTATATVTITVTAVNDAPVANDDNANVNEDGTVDIPVLSNDTDLDGDTLSVTAVSDPANGTASINPDGTVNYTPEANFCGTDTLTYDISDGNGGTDTATVTVVVACVNDGPVAVEDSYSTDEDTTLTVAAPGILGNDSDVDGDALTVTLLTNPSNGTLTQNVDGSFIYTPNADFNGTDSYTYKACDPSGLCDSATVTITVNAVNDAPVAANDSYSTDEDTTLTVAAPGILGNDSDVDGDALTVTLLTNPSNGTLTQNADGSFIYTPNADFNGTDSYTYKACDPSGLCDSAAVTITVNAVNDVPVAVDDVDTTGQDTPVTTTVLSNDTDVDGDTLTVTNATDGSFGTTTVNADGTITYSPVPGFCGEDEYSYTISDGNGGSDTARVTVIVSCKDQRSIQVEANNDANLSDGNLTGALETLTGSFEIKNVSSLQPSTVLISSVEIGVEVRYGSKGRWKTLTDAADCTFNPEVPFYLTDTQVVTYSCTLLDTTSGNPRGIVSGDVVRITAHVNIFEGHTNFKSSTSMSVE